MMRIQPSRFQLLASPLLQRVTKTELCSRCLHQQVSARDIPPPTPWVPDSKTFLTLIGRNLLQHAAKIPSWQSLFSLQSSELRNLGVEPARTRRYLLWWRDRFKSGIHGIGGDLQEVTDGTAKLAVVKVISGKGKNGLLPPKKLVVNVPMDAQNASVVTDPKPVQGMKVRGAQTIVGPYIQAVKDSKGTLATIKIQEGMWEIKRGHKVDGGERRKEQVRRRREIEKERKAKR